MNSWRFRLCNLVNLRWGCSQRAVSADTRTLWMNSTTRRIFSTCIFNSRAEAHYAKKAGGRIQPHDFMFSTRGTSKAAFQRSSPCRTMAAGLPSYKPTSVWGLLERSPRRLFQGAWQLQRELAQSCLAASRARTEAALVWVLPQTAGKGTSNGWGWGGSSSRPDMSNDWGKHRRRGQAHRP